MRLIGRRYADLIGAVASPLSPPSILQARLPMTRATDTGFTQGAGSGATTEGVLSPSVLAGSNTTLLLGAAALGLAAFWLLGQKS